MLFKHIEFNMSFNYRLSDTRSLLCGDVSAKLEAAREAAIYDPSFTREVEALTKALPTEIPLEDVDIRIGTSWIPLKYYEQFVREVFEEEAKFFYSVSTGTWDVALLSKGTSQANTSQYGFKYPTMDGDGLATEETIPAIAKSPEDGLFTMALHFKSPKVSIKKDKNSAPQKCQIETGRAVAKQEELQELFANWCKEADQWSADGERRQFLQDLYNQKMNRIVLPNWDGSAPSTLPDTLRETGLSEKWLERVRSRPFQLDAIWRMAVSRENTGLGEEVGLGKTIQAICAFMLRKHFKLATKGMFVLQKSTLKQFDATFREAYPKAKILCATGKDCSLGNRQKFLAKAAFWEWDAVLLTHENFRAIPTRAETEIAFIERQLNEVLAELDRLESMGESSKRKGAKRGNRVMKKLETTRNVLIARINSLKQSHDTGIYFEDISPNPLIIDECQRFKNNLVVTKLQVNGVQVNESGRAQDLDLKLSHLRSRYEASYLWCLTGTPEPTNSMVGVFVFQRYQQPELLEERGLMHFDAWAMNHGRVVSKMEPKPDGSHQMTDRFSEFVNLPELLQMWLSCWHIKRYKDVSDQAGFIRPEPVIKKITSRLSPFQREHMQKLQVRLDAIIKHNPMKWPRRDEAGYLLDEERDRLVHPITKEFIKDTETAGLYGLSYDRKTDNHFNIITESRQLMIAPQLIDPEQPMEEGDKLSQAVKLIHLNWERSKARKSTSLVFLDMGTPGGKAKFPIYEWMREQLHELGIPMEDMAFIQDCKTDEDKERLFEKVNAGDVRVLFGSTEPMGIGVNVQTRVEYVYLLDIPRRPDEYEQRLGRAIRYGNVNQKVVVYQFVTRGVKGNFGADAYLLGRLQDKINSREQILRADPSVRRYVEDNEAMETFMLLKAHATGDKRYLRFSAVEAELDKAKARNNLILREINRLSLGEKEGSIKYAQKSVERLELEVNNVKVDAEWVRDRVASCTGDYFHMEVDGEEYVGADFQVDRVSTKTYSFLLRYCLFNPDLAPLLTTCRYTLASTKKAQRLAHDHLQQVIASIKLNVSMTGHGNGQHHKIGKFGGMPIVVAVHTFAGKETITLWLEGQLMSYRFAHRVSKLLLIENLINAYTGVLDGEDRTLRLLAKARNSVEQLKAQLENKKRDRAALQKLVLDLTVEHKQLAEVLNMTTSV